MSGHYSRKIYDNCYSHEFINQQINPCNYRTYEPYAENKQKCHSLNGPRANKSRATGELGNNKIGFRTEIESQLYNLDIPDSRCVTTRTMREKNERLANVLKTKKVKYTECNTNQDIIYSRLDRDVNEFRSVYINRFGFPIIDPKENVYYGFSKDGQSGNQRWGVNTQLADKDKINKPNMNPNSKLTK